MKLYDTGYSNCDCYWGIEPASLVKDAIKILTSKTAPTDLKAIDLGCGEGKNVNCIAEVGISVLGVELSEEAVKNSRKICQNINATIIIASMLEVDALNETFDLVVSTGSVHCLKNENEVSIMIDKIKRILKPGGLAVFSAFNDRRHDFSGHPVDFAPILLPHSFYKNAFFNMETLHCSDKDLNDIHPDNNIPHFHSITRMLVKK